MKIIFTRSKLRIVMASAVTIILIILTFLAMLGDETKGPVLALLLFLTIVAGLLIAIEFRLPKLLGIIILILVPILALCSMEFYTHVPWDLTVPIFLLNLIFYYLLYAICSLLLGGTRWGYALATAVPMLFGIANFFVISFRGSPIVPWDFLSLGTATSVADNYNFTFTYRLVGVILGFVYLMILSEKTDFTVKRMKIRVCALLVVIICLIGYLSAVKTDTVKETFGLDDILFTPNVLYRNNGFMVAFFSNFRYIDVEKPSDYSVDTVKAEEENRKIEKESDKDVPVKSKEDMPNIIVIMNEAFSDLAVNGEFETNEDYMPFFHSMEEDTAKGNLFVSVKGGNTANTEFEFLTGSTMAFLPVGSVAYQQFVNGQMPTLASYLKGMGYSTKAIHPYYDGGWNRDKVYPYFGFDDFYSIDDFEGASTLRGYVSDQASFDKIIELYENKGENEKLFAFEVTMQNHGGYSKEDSDFSSTISLTQIPEEEKTLSVKSTEKYLSLVKESDKAFENLVNYFENQDEDTIIVMFGDHQPADYITDVITKKINNQDPESSLETMQNGYQVPLVMWANYDIPEQELGDLSVNYLSGVLMEQAGIPLTDYQSYLQELRETLPVITSKGYMDKDGNHYQQSDAAYKELLNKYSILQYNFLCDSKNRVNPFFGEIEKVE